MTDLSLPSRIHDAIVAVCPVAGISFGEMTDKSTWILHFEDSATDAQKTAAASVVANFDVNAPAPVLTVLSQDLMAQFTPTDITTIQTAISSNASLALLWYSLLAQRDPMQVSNARFLAGWSALVSVLGQPRMTEIATALNVTIG